MKTGKIMGAPLLALCGLLLLAAPSWSQSKVGKDVQENLNKSKAYQDAKDAKKDPNAVFDGSRPQQPKDPVKVEKSTSTVQNRMIMSRVKSRCSSEPVALLAREMIAKNDAGKQPNRSTTAWK